MEEVGQLPDGLWSLGVPLLMLGLVVVAAIFFSRIQIK